MKGQKIRTIANQSGRFIELDYLRGLAAMAVVLFHFTYGYDNGLKILSPEKFYFTYGKLGVNLFFIISGYVIFMTLEKVNRPMDFIVSRFARLYPAYWSAIIFSMIFVTLVKNPFGYEKIGLPQILINFTMFQHWLKVKDIDGAYWTLSIELTFYIIMFVLFNLNQLKKIEIYCFAWLLLALLGTIHKIPFQKYLDELAILKFCSLFIAGILFYQIKFYGGNIFRYLLLLGSLAIQIFRDYISNRDWIDVIIIISFYILFLCLIKKKIKIKENRVLLFFGTISYPLYLIHENVGLTLIYHFKRILDKQIFYVGVSVCLVVLIASLITYLIEKPLLTMIKTFYKTKSTPMSITDKTSMPI